MYKYSDRIENNVPELPPYSVLISSLHGLENCKGYAIDIFGNAWTCKERNTSINQFKTDWSKLCLKNNRHGYPFVIMSSNPKKITKKIHRLVSAAFLDNPNGYKEINHIDGDKLNNCIDNLEWCTHKYNIAHCIENGLRNTAKGIRVRGAILNDEKVREIRAIKKTGLLNKQIAAMYGIEVSGISRILNNKCWAHVI